MERKELLAGDNGCRSVDSRVWGPLQQKYLIGTAQWVVWPLDQFGPILAHGHHAMANNQ